MDDRIYLINLYDYYAELLTEKQKNYFEDYYFNNLTLAEIGENYKVSRNAVYKQIKEVEIKLNFYESKLNLLSNGNKIRELIKNLDIKEKIEELI